MRTDMRAPSFLRRLYFPSRYDLSRWWTRGRREARRAWCRHWHGSPRRAALIPAENGWICEVCTCHFRDLVDAGVVEPLAPPTREARVTLLRRLDAEEARKHAPVERGCVKCGRRPDARSGMMLCTKHYHRNRYRMRRRDRRSA